MAARIVGVDIGSSTIRAVEVENPLKGKTQVLRYHEVPLPAGAAQAGEVLETQTVASALRQLWSQGKFSSKNVVLGMGNQRVFARDLSLPKMSPIQLRESLPFHVQDMLPIPVADALLDFYPISESSGEQGELVNGLLVAAVKDTVLANVGAFKAAGLNVVDVDLIPFALTRIFTRGITVDSTVAIVNVGADTTNVVVAIAGVPQFVRIIPSGGADLTRALAARLSLTNEIAVQAKTVLGLPTGPVAPENRPAMEVIFEVTSELVNSIRNTIAYFDNTHDLPNVQHIILGGGGARLGGFGSALSELTRLQVVAPNPFQNVGVAKKLDQSALVGDNMAVALGLALGSAA
jgi:type IV pilus assembly protein PilM